MRLGRVAARAGAATLRSRRHEDLIGRGLGRWVSWLLVALLRTRFRGCLGLYRTLANRLLGARLPRLSLRHRGHGGCWRFLRHRTFRSFRCLVGMRRVRSIRERCARLRCVLIHPRCTVRVRRSVARRRGRCRRRGWRRNAAATALALRWDVRRRRRRQLLRGGDALLGLVVLRVLVPLVVALPEAQTHRYDASGSGDSGSATAATSGAGACEGAGASACTAASPRTGDAAGLLLAAS